MNLHQFRFVREAVRQNFNLTEAAKALFTSQPGVSKAIIELEEELGVDIFVRHGKRIRNLTEPGRIIFESVERILLEVESLKRMPHDVPAALRHYEALRKERATRVQMGSRARADVCQVISPLAQLRRDLGYLWNQWFNPGAAIQKADWIYGYDVAKVAA